MAVVATFACSSDDEPSDDTLFAILTDEEGNTEGLTGLVYARPVVVDGCLLLADSHAPERRWAGLWRAGTEASRADESITLPDGRVIAFGEDFVAGGGIVQRQIGIEVADSGRPDYAAASACATAEIAVISNVEWDE